MISRFNTALRYCALSLVLMLGACDDSPESTNTPPQMETEAGVYFSSNRSGNYELYRLHDSQLSPLTNDKEFDSWWPRQSPDGNTMLFYRTLIADRPDVGGYNNNYENASLWSLDLASSSVTELIPKGQNNWKAQGVVDWSPDGTRLIMAAIDASTNLWGLYITDALGRSPEKLPIQTVLALDPAWSPDGSKIVYTAFPPDYVGLDLARLEIYTADADGSNVVRLTDDLVRDHDPYWSPDGSTIAFETEVDPTYFGIGRWAVRLASVVDSSVEVVIDDGHINTLPRWSLDGSFLYFHRFEFGSGHGFIVASINTDGSNYQEITTGGDFDDTDIDWFRQIR